MKRTTKEVIALQERMHKIRKAGATADQLTDAFGVDSLPVDLHKIAAEEGRLLRVCHGDYGGTFDGQLEFHAQRGCFLLFFNSKYDARASSGQHHPRTRFSFAHELGHYHLEEHRAHLLDGAAPHRSGGEFDSRDLREREADAFAASLLMPTPLMKPLVRLGGELSRRRIEVLAETCQASLVSTALRSVDLADTPCAVAALKGGQRHWLFPSDAMIEAGCYPRPRGPIDSGSARAAWSQYERGEIVQQSSEGLVAGWFKTYEKRDHSDVILTEEFIPIPSMDTVLVILTMDEDDLFP